ncbi:hypothetical protein PAXINDRAFT_9255 [Paxillus involutus ATCC 200175]|nr:hypothetical protein PAXINDRAFT_9255 [Paxillus involutus ATCC 200175]
MGVVHSVVNELLFPPKPLFTQDSVPDLSGKVALVTGANAGIGKETARVLLAKNAKVWIACRDVSKGEAALKELKQRTGRDAHLLKLDLSNLKSIKDAASEFSRGSASYPLQQRVRTFGLFLYLTDDGYDLQFGTNVLGHFYLTKLLLPTLISTAKSSPEGTVRVVNTASNAHLLGGLEFDTFKDGPKRRADSTYRLYGQSKTGNIIFSAELHRRYQHQGIISTALNPGTSPEAAKLGGQYLIPWARIGTPQADTQDPQLGKELWAWLEEQVAV